MSKPLFTLGQLVITSNAQNALIPEDYVAAMSRHVRGDWGELSEEDKKQNDDAAKSGEDRIFSAYTDSNGTKFWIITEWDRSVTTVLLPSDY